ncbi:hypothetical protein TNCV_3539691 [Trichonephila clavipes]|nr:hypothetical protein TNCV_3539691 [Trichonephila clavipes]
MSYDRLLALSGRFFFKSLHPFFFHGDLKNFSCHEDHFMQMFGSLPGAINEELIYSDAPKHFYKFETEYRECPTLTSGSKTMLRTCLSLGYHSKLHVFIGNSGYYMISRRNP